MKIIFKITITKNYKLTISIIQEGKEEIIQQEVSPCITFNTNTIDLFQENDRAIYFLQSWIEKPDDYRSYSIQFQNKSYELLPEVLFAIVIDEIKKKVEKEFIVDETLVEIPSRDYVVIERIKTSLESVGLKNIFINPLTYDYSEQGEFLQDILEKKVNIESFKLMIERAKEIEPNAQKELETIDLNQQDIYKDDEFIKEISKRFNTTERSKMKMCKLDNYCLFIASRYFESLDDHINLVKTCKRMRFNMEKFHYNPTSLNSETVKFFVNLETLHIYGEGDEYLKGGRIQAYCEWNKKGWHESEK